MNEEVELEVTLTLADILTEVESRCKRSDLIECILASSPKEGSKDAHHQNDYLTETTEDDDDEVLTLKELSNRLKDKKLDDSLNMMDGKRYEGKYSMREAINRLISLDSLSNISSPIKSNNSKMGCNSPLYKLLQSFSPSAIRYMDKQEEEGTHGNVFNFVQAMSPSTVNLSMMASSFNNNLLAATYEITTPGKVGTSGYTQTNVDTSTSTYTQSNIHASSSYYPGSMFASNTDNTEALPDLDSYFTETEESSQNDTFPQHVNRNYQDQIVNSSEQQNTWQEMNPLQSYLPENMLAPVMLSSYEDMAFLQQQIMANNSVQQQQQQYVLPVFFQPVMVPDQEKVSKKSNKKRKYPGPENDEVNSVDQKVPDGRIKVAADWLSNLPTDDELLAQCKIALGADACEIRSQNTPSVDNMKYLEEAAVKLLQGGIKTEYSPGRFECEYCQRRFRRMYTLQAHERIHTGDKPFKCEYCNKGFRQSGTKLNHVRAVHTKEKPFLCEFCPKSFSHKSSAIVHKRIHTKEKPHKCKICERRFTDRATYLKHGTTHTHVKPYRCPLCSTCFSQKSNLKRHFRNVHEMRTKDLVEICPESLFTSK